MVSAVPWQPTEHSCRLPSDVSTSGIPGSRDTDPAAILTYLAVDIETESDTSSSFLDSSPSSATGTLLFVTPSFEGITPIAIFHDCVLGTCECVHLIVDFPCQLKPCRAASFLFGDSALDSVTEAERLYIWRGLVNGFAIVDDNCSSEYICENYDSITSDEAYDEMSALLSSELTEVHLISDIHQFSNSKPKFRIFYQ